VAPKVDLKNIMLPLELVAVLLMAVVGSTASGVFWISKVNERLGRIEKSLGIVEAPAGLVNRVEARELIHGSDFEKK
jgi:hypothetical protein